jgi:hypothetical protein
MRLLSTCSFAFCCVEVSLSLSCASSHHTGQDANRCKALKNLLLVQEVLPTSALNKLKEVKTLPRRLEQLKDRSQLYAKQGDARMTMVRNQD